MSQIQTRTSVYRALRKVVTQLGDLQGKTDTGDIIFGLDRLWRSLLKTRKIILDTLKEQGQVTNANDLPLFDFYNLYAQIYSPRTTSTTLCNGCGSRIDKILDACPFCQTKNIPDHQVELETVDFGVFNGAPNWDIQVTADDIFSEMLPTDEVLKPVTARDDIPGPKGHSGQTRRRRRDKLSASTKKMIVWMRKREFAKFSPYTVEQLCGIGFYDLRTIATMIAGYKPEVVSRYTRDELIAYILGDQGKEKLDAGPPPVGRISDIEEVFSDS